MKSFDIYNAYCGAVKLSNCKNIPFESRIQIIQIKKTLEPVAIAYEKSEIDIANQYGDKDQNGNAIVTDGFVKISDPEKRQESIAAHNSLKQKEVEVCFARVKIEISKIDGSELDGKDIENIMLFADFI